MSNRCKEKVRKMFIVKGYLSEKKKHKNRSVFSGLQDIFFLGVFSILCRSSTFFFFGYIELIFTIREKQRMEILRIFDLSSSLKGQEKTTY